MPPAKKSLVNHLKLLGLPAVLTFLFWLALSGHYTVLITSFGVASVIFVTFICHRMNIADHEGHPVHLFGWRLFPYSIWLLKEIVVSSVAVSRIIWSPKPELYPDVGNVPAENLTDLEKVIYANSITLTPGTLTTHVGDDYLKVHTVRFDMLESLREGTMLGKVRSIRMRLKSKK